MNGFNLKELSSPSADKSCLILIQAAYFVYCVEAGVLDPATSFQLLTQMFINPS